MPTETLAASLFAAPRRWWPEALLALLAGAVFLGCLGSVELWGKREQRASAEAIDTVDHNHWLVAQIQGRPRLEKPPLPRWSIAALMIADRPPRRMGRSGFPVRSRAWPRWRSSFFWGRHGGPSLGLASAFVLCSMGFFVGEMRQASNDCLLVLFVTLALYAAYRRLHDRPESRLLDQAPVRASRWQGSGAWSSTPRWGWAFLTKGPVILLLVGVTLVPYLAFARRLRSGLRRLCDGWGLLIFARLALCWPAAVLLDDPGALRVWSLEMSEKTGLSHILEHRWHAPLGGPVARFGAALDAHRRCCGRCCRFCDGDHQSATTAQPATWRPCRPLASQSGDCLVRLVVGHWKPRGVLLRGRSPSRIITPRACPAWRC